MQAKYCIRSLTRRTNYLSRPPSEGKNSAMDSIPGSVSGRWLSKRLNRPGNQAGVILRLDIHKSVPGLEQLAGLLCIFDFMREAGNPDSKAVGPRGWVGCVLVDQMLQEGRIHAAQRANSPGILPSAPPGLCNP